MMNIPFPRLLNPTTMQEIRRITPISASVNLSITPLSTATLVVDIDDDIPLRSYIEMYTTEGSAGVYRVRDIQSEYGTRNIKTLSLEHSFCEFADFMHGDSTGEEENVSVKTAVNQILSALNNAVINRGFRFHWSLGACDSSDTVVTNFFASSCSYLENLTGIMEQIPNFYITFDQTSLPWKFGIVARPSAVTAEGRLSRNVRNAVVRQDDREYANRVVIVTYKNVTVDDETYRTVDKMVEKNDSALIAADGCVNYVETMEDGTSETVMTRYATRQLNKRKEFTVSVSIDAIDLAQITGESLDSFKIGKKFRLAIDNFVKEENITGISWNDVYGDPLNVSITLAEPPEKVSKILHKNDKDKVSKKKKA